MAKAEKLTAAEVLRQAQRLGAVWAGFAPVGKSRSGAVVYTGPAPEELWPQTQSVLVLGIPKMETAKALPGIIGMEHWNAATEILDFAAYRLAVWLNEAGFPSVNIPADSCGDTVPEHKSVLVFSHVEAALQADFSLQEMPPSKAMTSEAQWVSVLTELTVADQEEVS
ncbi:hypothetical protein [Anaeroarcus burkinensis]|uniref:hypothetical protein n=1 Tax=Anaeroarcus burkinensis TaxID=82376 RepID=UPI000428313B|nr:hypothetical protein [Anaeroarcus burkinensis]